MGNTKLTAKLMEEGLKHGWTSVEFCESLQMDTNQFIAAVEKNFSSRAASSYLRKLKKNEKKPIMTKKGSGSTTSKKNTFILDPATMDTVPVVPKKVEPTLEDLQADLDSINKMLINLETSRKDLVSKNSDLRNKIDANIFELKDLRSQFQSLAAETENLQDIIEHNLEKISSINENISSVSAGKEILIQKIKDLQKVTILLNDDGTIESEKSQLEIPDTWEDIYQQLFSGELGHNDIIDQLTRGQIKQAAKVIAFVRNLDVSYEYISDNAAVQQLLDTLL